MSQEQHQQQPPIGISPDLIQMLINFLDGDEVKIVGRQRRLLSNNLENLLAQYYSQSKQIPGDGNKPEKNTPTKQGQKDPDK